MLNLKSANKGEALSPTVVMLIVSVLAVCVTEVVLDGINVSFDNVSSVVVSGESRNLVRASALTSKKQLPLYASQARERALFKSISESIFTHTIPDPKDIVDAEITISSEPAIEFDWVVATKKTLTLNGVSELGQSAYINGVRFVVGDVLNSFPIIGETVSKVAKLVRVTGDYAVVNFDDNNIKLRMADD